MPAAWAAWVIEAVEKWVTLQGDQAAPDGWRCVGRATPAGEAGWLVLDTRDHPLHADTVGDICLAGELGPEHTPSHLLEEFRLAHGVVLLREPSGLPRYSRFVWVRGSSRRRLLEALRKGLRVGGPAPLAAALAAGTLSGPPDATVAVPAGLAGAQVEAYRACRSPGVRLVWGPPGTGKTHVLARAAQDLVAAGQRVLLVSAANAAVDAALLAALPGLPDAPGAVVRVGPAHLPEVAGNPAVQLDLLAGRASGDVDRRRARVARQLDELAAVDHDVDDLVTRLAGYDDVTYRAAASRIAAAQEVAGLEPGLRTAETTLQGVRAEVAGALAEAERAEAERAGLAAARAELDRAAALAVEQERAEREVRRRGLGFATVDAVPEHHGGLFARRRRRKEAARVTAELRAAEAARDRIRAAIAQHRAAADPVTPDDLAAADRRWERVGAAAAIAREEIAAAQAVRDNLAGRIAALRAAGAPTDADRELVRRCEEQQFPESHERLRHLLVLQTGSAGLRSRLETELRELGERSRALRTEAEDQLVGDARLVVTTPGRARIHPALADAAFDVVLVDEAGASPLAELLLVLCRAVGTAVLFGDFRRPAAALAPTVERSEDAAVRRWVHGDCFTHAGVRTPADALRLEGCVPLLHEFRYGPGLRRLVNDTGYEVLRAAAELPGVAAGAEAEVVLVDVGTLAHLAAVRHGRRGGRWHVAGALLPAVFARLHAGAGIVTPYRLQAETTLAVLRDRGMAEVPVGVAAEVPDREFEVAVLDLVDDGPGWAGRGETPADGVLRLFGAALTAAVTRLYVLVDAGAARSATAGPLLHVRGALERGDARVWSAAALLGLADPPAVVVDSAFADAAQVAQALLPVTDLHDDEAFAAELGRHVERARHTIWMWSPWPAARTPAVTGLLAAAVARSVDVRVFLRPDEDRAPGSDPAGDDLAALIEAGATRVIRSGHERRGAVVVDGRTVLLGTGGTPGREGVVTFTGPRFAERLLDELHGRAGGRPRACPGCGTGLEGLRGGGRGRELRWLCAPCRQVPGGAPEGANSARG